MASTISISRPRDAFGVFRRYRVFLDGREVAKLAYGTTNKLSVLPGAHRIQVRIDWWLSNVLSVDTEDGVVHELEVGTNIRGWRLVLLILTLWFFSFWPTEWLWIRPKPGQPTVCREKPGNSSRSPEKSSNEDPGHNQSVQRIAYTLARSGSR